MSQSATLPNGGNQWIFLWKMPLQCPSLDRSQLNGLASSKLMVGGSTVDSDSAKSSATHSSRCCAQVSHVTFGLIYVGRPMVSHWKDGRSETGRRFLRGQQLRQEVETSGTICSMIAGHMTFIYYIKGEQEWRVAAAAVTHSFESRRVFFFSLNRLPSVQQIVGTSFHSFGAASSFYGLGTKSLVAIALLSFDSHIYCGSRWWFSPALNGFIRLLLRQSPVVSHWLLAQFWWNVDSSYTIR